MALDLETAIKNFEAASTGEDVRARLYELLNILANADINVQYLNGKPQGEYVLHETVNTNIIDNLIKLYFKGFDTEPKTPSVKFIKSKDLDKLFTDVMTKLRGVSGSNTDQTLDTIEGYLTYIYNRMYSSDVHVGIKAAIESHDSLSHPGEKISIDETVSIMDYDQKILDIDDHSLKVEPLKITELGEHIYTAPEGKAYNPIVTAVPIKTGPLVATENGTYDDPSKYGYDAFSSVVAKVPIENPNSSGSSSGGGSGSSTSSGERTYNLISKEVTTNGTWNASDEGADAFESFDTTNVREFTVDPDKRFKVEFEVEGEIVKTVEDVVPGSFVNYFDADEDHPDGYPMPEHSYVGELYVFNGWEPAPFRVYSDMKCVAQFTRYSGVPVVKTAKTTSLKYYEDNDWEGICESGGLDVPPGSIKVLYLPGIGFIRMQKVTAVGQDSGKESGANSVWVSMDNLPAYDYDSHKPYTGCTNGKVDDSKPYTWENSLLRQWLQNDFFDKLPKCLKNHIVPMTKYQIDVDSSGKMYDGTQTDTIWIPSLKEMNIYAAGELVKESTNDYKMMNSGVTYSQFSYLMGDGHGNLWGRKDFPAPSRVNGSSWNTLMDNINGESSEFSYIEKIFCMIPHIKTDHYMYYNQDDDDWYEASDFDQLSWDDKVRVMRYYGSKIPPAEKNPKGLPTVPNVDTKALHYDYPNEFFSSGNGYRGFGYYYYSLTSTAGMWSYDDRTPTIFRDSSNGNRSFITVIMGGWGGSSAWGPAYPSIMTAPTDNVNNFVNSAWGPAFSDRTCDARICFGIKG